MGNRGDVFMLDIDGDGGALHVITPASVLSVHDAEALSELLTKYEDPVRNKVIKNTSKDRRWFVEKVLPALRFFCKRYGVDVPSWLATNGHWERMTDEERAQLFGPEPLRFREFMPVEQPDIQVIREEEEQPGG